MSQLSNKKLVFDLDGTLIDTAPDLVRVLNETIVRIGLENVDFESLRNQVGFGSRHLITRACQAAGHNISEDEITPLVKDFIARYEANIAELSRPFDGIIDTLRKLNAQGAVLSVCTNKPQFLADKLLKTMNMERLFNRVVGQTDKLPTKPKPDMIFAAAQTRNPQDIIMIGDTRADILAARAALVPCVAVSYGYSAEPLEPLRPTCIVRNAHELFDAVKFTSSHPAHTNMSKVRG